MRYFTRKQTSMKTIKYEDIKTATTVAEFRENLKKYFLITTDTANNAELVVRSNDKQRIEIDKLNTLSDLFNLGVTHIVPTIAINTDQITQQEIIKNMFTRDFSSVLNDSSRFPIYEMNNHKDRSDFLDCVDVMFYSVDNQILRSFYVKTLGKFSGYVSSEQKEVA